MDYDIAIVGSGAAGIAAARAVQATGRSAILIESADRVGGRAWTIALGGIPLDLGCGWLHSADRNPLVAVGEAAGFAIDRTPSAWGRQWRNLGFTRDEQAAAGTAWAALDQRLHRDPPPSDRAADALPPDGPWNAYCQALSGYMNGAMLDRLSIADFLAYDDAASDTNWRMPDGYGTLIAASLPPVTVRMSTPVRRIALTDRGVRLETARGAIGVGASIVTVSTAVLSGGGIAFDAEVSDHLHAASRLPLGLADKLFIELGGLHGLDADTHLLGDPRNARTGSYHIRPFGRKVIECFFGGAGAAALEREGVAAAFDFAVGELCGLLGNDIRRHLRPLIASTWCRTDGIGGSYSHALPGHADARATLARPVGDRLFFAGEATHPTEFSTAHGAWESGIRAAGEALAAIG